MPPAFDTLVVGDPIRI